jgi:Enolase, C-terminal TIM barrel domain
MPANGYPNWLSGAGTSRSRPSRTCWRIRTGPAGGSRRPSWRAFQLLGDDLFVTDSTRLARGVDDGVANAVLVKPNQTGTLTDAVRVVDQARAAIRHPAVGAFG